METIMHWIDGKPWSGRPERLGAVFDPARGRQIAQVAYASEVEVDAAVASARRAATSWRATPVTRRAHCLFRLREALESGCDALARAITREHGKTLEDARGEVQRGLEVVEFACGIPHLLKGDASVEVGRGVDLTATREPLGVVAGITPFNFPAMVPLWMFPIAIACGNAFVLKPSEKDPSPALLLADFCAQAGIPDGVLNVVHGDRLAVDHLLAHPEVAALSFVGSTPVARHVYETGTRHAKRVQALGGAKNHMVVLPDADLALAADAAVSAGFGSAGERCMAISVVVAVGDVADALVPAIAERVRALRLGPGERPESELPPLITAEHRDRVAAYVGRGEREGATLVVDGRDARVPGCESGFFLGASLFDHVTPEMMIYRDEIFGPLLCVVRSERFEDAVALVNRNPWANGVALFTQDGGAARRFQREIEVGMVGINVPIPVPLGFYSFGGWRDSMFGDHSVYGSEAVHFYTRPKIVTTRWPDPSQRGVDLGFPRTR